MWGLLWSFPKQFVYLKSRGGSRISEKGVHMFKGVGVPFADFISFILNIQWKWNNLVSLRPNYFIFIGYLKTRGGQGCSSQHLNPLWIRHWSLYTYENREDPSAMPQSVAFHQALHCMLRHVQSSGNRMHFNLKILTFNPLIFIINNAKLIVFNQTEESISIHFTSQPFSDQ